MGRPLKGNRAKFLLPFLLVLLGVLGFLLHSRHNNSLHVLELPEHLNNQPAHSELAVDDQVDVGASIPEPPLRPISPPLPPLYPPLPPKLTLIALWSTRARPAIYLPNFFSSVAANPSIDLLFIKFGHIQGGCHQPMAAGYPNVREVCLSASEYWELHADFLCGQWGCSGDNRTRLLDKLVERAENDRVRGCVSSLPNPRSSSIAQVNSYFRPFRAAVFEKWIHPETKTWVSRRGTLIHHSGVHVLFS